MQLIRHKEYNKELTQSSDDRFDVDHDGLYLVEIIASAKSWWQNTATRRIFLNKDSLTIQINARGFALSAKRKKIFADDLWNGNILKGNEQAVYVATGLTKGQVTISFDAHGKPLLKSVNIYLLEDATILLQPIVRSTKDRAPWLIFITSDEFFFHSILIDAKADVFGNDDDDLRLSINGERQEEVRRRTHREWYWCGYALRGKSKIFSKSFDVSIKPSRIDIVADGQPRISEIKIGCARNDSSTSFALPQSYKPGLKREDYNKYDREIGKAVQFWNSEFLKKNHPVPDPLDPSLIKAIAYIESRLGFGVDAVGYPPHPDIMQVGDERNPAIHVLRNEKGFTEREWDDEKERSMPLGFDKTVAVQTVEESIFWGVRWLYHKAQYIKNNQRKWKTWDDAVEGYHQNGNKHYRERVMKVFRQGADGGILLWVSLLLISILTLGTWSAFAELRNDVRSNTSDALFDVMKNAVYRIDSTTVKLNHGLWIFKDALDEKAAKRINPYDFFDGPYYVRYENGAIGDLNSDGIQDVIAVLGVNYGGTGYYPYLAALLFQKDGTYRYAALYKFEDRDSVKALSIHRGIIIVKAVLHSPDDPYCCPTVHTIKKLTLSDFL